jgi:transposase
MVDRAQFVLHAAAGKSNQEIAVALNVRATTVGKWRSRFARERLAGLRDEPRPGPPRTYDEKTEQRILAMLDTPPPEGYGTWTGGLLAQALSDVSDDQIWRVLRQRNISLQRRRSWCISTDPEFAAKAADITGLYLNPPENALVL